MTSYIYTPFICTRTPVQPRGLAQSTGPHPLFQEPLTQLSTHPSASPGTRRAVKDSQCSFQQGANTGCAWNEGSVTLRSQGGGGGYSLQSVIYSDACQALTAAQTSGVRFPQTPSLCTLQSPANSSLACDPAQLSGGSSASSRHSPCPQPLKAG